MADDTNNPIGTPTTSTTPAYKPVAVSSDEFSILQPGPTDASNKAGLENGTQPQPPTPVKPVADPIKNPGIDELQKGTELPAPDKAPKIEDFNKVMGESFKLPTGDKKEKVVDPAAKPQDNTTVKPNVTPVDVSKTPNARDYTGFTESEAEHLKKMSNEAYEWTRKNVLESRQNIEKLTKERDEIKAKYTDATKGKETLPESFYQHPNAIWLSPEVIQMQGGIDQAKDVQTFWEQQLILAEDGKAFKQLVRDPKTQQIVIDPTDIEPTTANKLALKKNYDFANGQVRELETKLSSFVGGFQERNKAFTSKIREAEKTMLPVFEDDKGEPYKFFQSVKTDLIKQFGIDPHNPILDMYAKTSAMLLMAKEFYETQQAAKTAEEIKKEEVRRAGPNANVTTGAPVNGAAPTVTLADYDKMLNNR